MAKIKRGETSNVTFVPVPQRSHVHYVLDLTEKNFKLPDEFPEAKDALIKVSIKYLSSEEGLANETIQKFLEIVTPIARYVRVPERSAIPIRNRKNPELTLQLPPFEAFVSYLDGKNLPDNLKQDRLLSTFNSTLNEIPELVRNMERNSFTAPKIDRVLIKDFMPFSGSFDISNLPEGLIGIVGKYEDQDGRSNRAGKSSFLDGILFALISEYRNVKMNHLIHQGTEKATLEVDLSWTGGKSTFQRKIVESTLGGTSQIQVNGNACKNVDAQIEFKRIFGMEKEDFLKTSYVRQGDLEAVFEQGATRLREDIVRWKHLQIWDQLSDIFNKKIKEFDQNERFSRETLRQANEELLVPIPSDAEIQELKDKIEVERGIRDSMIGLRKELEGIEKMERILERFDDIEDNAKKEVKLKKKLATIDHEKPKIQEEVDLLSGKISVLDSRINDLLVVGKQGFSGMCPVVQKPCPTRKMVDSNLESVKNAIYTARADVEKIKIEYRDKKMNLLNIQDEFSDTKVQLGFIARLREDYNKWPGPTKPEVQKDLKDKRKLLHGMAHNYDRLREHWERMQLDIAAHNRVKANIEKHTKIIKQIHEEKRYLLWLKLATGKSGIPFQLIEDALEDIEGQVNQILEELGTDHRIHFESEKENRKYESVCSYCGHTYAKGNITNCPECSAVRTLEFKAEIRPMVLEGSRVQSLNLDSGAGRALISLATRIAISRFLGASILFLDEVTGSLDAYHLGLIIRLLHRLPALGFRQIFVISHQKEVDESIPFQIKIRRLPNKQYSTIER